MWEKVLSFAELVASVLEELPLEWPQRESGGRFGKTTVVAHK